MFTKYISLLIDEPSMKEHTSCALNSQFRKALNDLGDGLYLLTEKRLNIPVQVALIFHAEHLDKMMSSFESIIIAQEWKLHYNSCSDSYAQKSIAFSSWKNGGPTVFCPSYYNGRHFCLQRVTSHTERMLLALTYSLSLISSVLSRCLGIECGDTKYTTTSKASVCACNEVCRLVGIPLISSSDPDIMSISSFKNPVLYTQ